MFIYQKYAGDFYKIRNSTNFDIRIMQFWSKSKKKSLLKKLKFYR